MSKTCKNTVTFNTIYTIWSKRHHPDRDCHWPSANRTKTTHYKDFISYDQPPKNHHRSFKPFKPVENITMRTRHSIKQFTLNLSLATVKLFIALSKKNRKTESITIHTQRLHLSTTWRIRLRSCFHGSTSPWWKILWLLISFTRFDQKDITSIEIVIGHPPIQRKLFITKISFLATSHQKLPSEFQII